jgi:hypothetical protein
MTVEATLPEREPARSVAEIGSQMHRRDSLQAVGRLLGILVIVLRVALVIGIAPPSGLT